MSGAVVARKDTVFVGLKKRSVFTDNAALLLYYSISWSKMSLLMHDSGMGAENNLSFVACLQGLTRSRAHVTLLLTLLYNSTLRNGQ